MKKYSAFGLIIETELIFDELFPCPAGDTDIVIKKESVPDHLTDMTLQADGIQIGIDQYWSDIKEVAKFYVSYGTTILYEPYDNAADEEIKLYLLGSCMGAVLFQRRILPLHGSCVKVNGAGLLITGDPGAGKSTTAAVLYKKGYKIISDDVSAILSSPGEVMVCPSYPSQKLWEDTIERVGIQGEKNVLHRISNHLYKYSVINGATYDETPVPLKTVLEIIPLDIDHLQLQEIKGGQKLELISKNTYRKIMVDAMDIREWHFKQCLEIAERVSVYRMLRPKHRYLENELANMILEKIL